MSLVRTIACSLLLAAMSFAQAPSSPMELPPGMPARFDPSNPLVVPPGTTVQLPQFNFFTISTTVMVPDSGGAFSGGVGGGASGSRTNGMPGLGKTAGASSVSAGGVSVSAQIHDMRAMDRALLSDSVAEREAAAGQLWVARMQRAKQSTAGRPSMSVAEARRLAR